MFGIFSARKATEGFRIFSARKATEVFGIFSARKATEGFRIFSARKATEILAPEKQLQILVWDSFLWLYVGVLVLGQQMFLSLKWHV